MTTQEQSESLAERVFWEAVLTHKKQLLQRARHLTRSQHNAEDLVQETLIRAVMRREQFKTGSNLRAWLYTIMRNIFLSGRRKSWRELALHPEWDAATEDGPGSSAFEDGDELEYDFEVIVHCLAQLPDEMCESLILSHYAELSYEHIATEQHVAEGTIKSRISRAIERINRQLSVGKIIVCNVEQWLALKILTAHSQDRTVLAKAYEQMLVTYKTVRLRITAPETSDETSQLSTTAVDAAIENLFDDF